MKPCPINRTCRIEFETDADNDYFTRADSPGTLLLSPANLIEHSSLWNGRFVAQFSVPWNASPGDRILVEVKVEDVESELRGALCSSFTLVAEPECDSKPGGKPRGTGTPKTEPRNGKNTSQRLALPEIRDMHSPDLPYVALQVKHDDKGAYEFFLNLDNTFLLTELMRSREDDRGLILYWFKYGLALCALGILQEEKRRIQNRKDTENVEAEPDETGEVDLKRVNETCDGLARVIVPIIRALYRGPLLASAATA